MDQAERCLERAAFIEDVAQRISVVEQRGLLLEIAAQWRRKAGEAGARKAARPTCQPTPVPPEPEGG